MPQPSRTPICLAEALGRAGELHVLAGAAFRSRLNGS
jgi:hypothetical protein